MPTCCFARRIVMGAILIAALIGSATLAHSQTWTPPCPIPPPILGPQECTDWAERTKTIPISDLVPGCTVAPTCSLTVRYHEQICSDPDGLQVVCNIYVDEISYDQACDCPFYELAEAVYKKLLTSWCTCSGIAFCTHVANIYTAPCAKVIYVPGTNIYQVAADPNSCPTGTGCCAGEYIVCPDGTITTVNRAAPAVTCVQDLVIDLGLYINQCIAMCTYLPMTNPDVEQQLTAH